VVIADIFSAVDYLEQFPRSGRAVPEMSDTNLRELIIGSYRIIYDFNQSTVRVLTVIHSAQELNM